MSKLAQNDTETELKRTETHKKSKFKAANKRQHAHVHCWDFEVNITEEFPQKKKKIKPPTCSFSKKKLKKFNS